MHHLRLIKGLSYSGAVSATKGHPDVFVEDEKKYQRAMKSGYFEEIIDADATRKNPDAEARLGAETDREDRTDENSDVLEDMSSAELKAYASLNGIDIAGLKKKEEVLAAIKSAERKADEARTALRSE